MRHNVPPPTTTNKMMPSAQRLIGLRLASRSWREGRTAVLPWRTLLANCAFFWRSSNSVG